MKNLVFIVPLSILIALGVFTQMSVPNHTTETRKTVIVQNATNATPVLKTRVVRELNVKNVVFLLGAVAENSAQIASDITNKARSGPVTLIIDSPGGSVFDGALIVSAMEAAKSPVNTVCVGLCASMAAIIHQHGVKRYAVNRTVLMFHPASGGLRGTLQQMGSLLGMITRYVDKFDMFIANRAGLTFEQFRAMTVSELWIDAEDALDRKFVDELVTVNSLPVNLGTSNTNSELIEFTM